jgi:hypothetical protein
VTAVKLGGGSDGGAARGRYMNQAAAAALTMSSPAIPATIPAVRRDGRGIRSDNPASQSVGPALEAGTANTGDAVNDIPQVHWTFFPKHSIPN